MEKRQVELLNILSSYYTTATKNVSAIARTWSLAIVFPACTWLLKDNRTYVGLLIVIIGIALLSLLIDCAHNMFVSSITRRLIDRLYSDETLADSESVNRIMKPVHKNAHVMVIIKLGLMVMDTVLLVIYTLLML